ncbi:AraC family transcriptional regulator [Lachnospiraceae bacterium PM6-15]|uniref:AraC family transcriptional regulator n=1 Tax=Ohessyouella blattaphilus TaxID=2949333 RepID=UPI003E2EFA25
MNKEKLVNQSINYIMEHLNDDLSLDTIVAHLYISKFYFSRIFKEVTGESIYSFVKRCKIDQSAIDIKLNPEKTITDIGLDYGYSSSNYSTVFKKKLKTSPSTFKESLPVQSMSSPFIPEQTVHFKSYEEYNALIEVQEFDDLPVLCERFIGNYIDLEKNWYQFLDKNKNLLSAETILVERFFNDPSISNSSQCISDICMTVPNDYNSDNLELIEGGKWIVYPYTGEIKNIFETLQGIFSIWLPQSGYTMEQRYGLNIYHQIDRHRHHVVMDLCIPIK